MRFARLEARRWPRVETPAEPAPKARFDRRRLALWIPLVIGAMALCGWLTHRGQIVTFGRVAATPIRLTLPCAAQAAAIRVREGERVTRGQLLATFGDGILAAETARVRTRWEQARARLEEADGSEGEAQARVRLGAARRDLGLAREREGRARARIAVAEVQLGNVRAARERKERLFLLRAIGRDELDEARAAATKVEAELQYARTELDEARSSSEWASGLLRKEEALAESQTEALRSEVRCLEAELGALRAKGDALNVAAPCDGVVVSMAVRPGESVAAGVPFATLLDLGELSVEAYLPGDEFSKIREGHRAWVSFEGSEREYCGTVSLLAGIGARLRDPRIGPEVLRSPSDLSDLYHAVRILLPPETSAELRPERIAKVRVERKAGP